MDVARGRLRLVGWCVALAVTLGVLHQLPVPDAPFDLRSRDAAQLLPLLLRGARWVALACAWYLTGATALSALSALVRWRPLRRLDHALTVPVVRHVVRTGLGATLAVGVGLGPAAAAAAAPGPPGASGTPAPLAELADREPGTTADLPDRLPEARRPPARDPDRAGAAGDADHDPLGGPAAPPRAPALPPARAPQVADPAPATSAPATSAPATSAPATSAPATSAPTGRGDGVSSPGRDPAPEASGDRDAPADRATSPDPAGGADPVATTPTARATDDGVSPASTEDDVGAGGSGTAATHVVASGDSFWTIAADLVADELGREPDDTEVFERWIELMDANRDRLRIPGDPDLLLPGQELIIPPVRA